MRTLALSVLFLGMLLATEARSAVPDAAIQTLVHDLVVAWNKGDATDFARHFQIDGTFTNVNGTRFEGRAAFEERHRAIFSGPFKGSSVQMTIQRVRLIRPDVAIVDVDTATSGGDVPPITSKLLLVLSKDGGSWSIAGFHNTAVQSTPLVR